MFSQLLVEARGVICFDSVCDSGQHAWLGVARLCPFGHLRVTSANCGQSSLGQCLDLDVRTGAREMLGPTPAARSLWEGTLSSLMARPLAWCWCPPVWGSQLPWRAGFLRALASLEARGFTVALNALNKVRCMVWLVWLNITRCQLVTFGGWFAERVNHQGQSHRDVEACSTVIVMRLSQARMTVSLQAVSSSPFGPDPRQRELRGRLPLPPALSHPLQPETFQTLPRAIAVQCVRWSWFLEVDVARRVWSTDQVCAETSMASRRSSSPSFVWR